MKRVLTAAIAWLALCCAVSAQGQLPGGGGAQMPTTPPYGRTLATATVNYWVTGAGSDSNDCRTSSTGCATIQAAVNKAYQNWDGGSSGNTFTNLVINLGASATYTGAVAFQGPLAGNAQFIVAGSGGGITVNTGSSNPTINVAYGAVVQIKTFTITNTGSGSCFQSQFGGVATVGSGMVFGNCADSQLFAEQGGTLIATSDYTISGGGISHLHIVGGAFVSIDNRTITCTGSPAFSTYFAGVSAAYLEAISVTFTSCGTVTGPRYTANRSGSIRTNTNNLTYFPGNSSGSLAGNAVFDDYGSFTGIFTIANIANYPCTANQTGISMMVSDAAASPVYNAIATGGGSTTTRITCDGTNWRNY